MGYLLVVEAYRDPAPRDLATTPAEPLVVEASPTDAGAARTFLLLQVFAVPPVVAAVCAATFSPEVGLVALVISAALCFAWFRRKKSTTFTFSVHERTLTVRSGRHVETVVLLEDLLTVELDTETIRRVQESGSAIPAVRFAEASAGPEIDQSRVVLVTREQKVPLGESRTAHMHATEALGKIRVFLRKRGWVPLDERGERDERDERDES